MRCLGRRPGLLRSATEWLAPAETSTTVCGGESGAAAMTESISSTGRQAEASSPVQTPETTTKHREERERERAGGRQSNNRDGERGAEAEWGAQCATTGTRDFKPGEWRQETER